MLITNKSSLCPLCKGAGKVKQDIPQYEMQSDPYGDTYTIRIATVALPCPVCGGDGLIETKEGTWSR